MKKITITQILSQPIILLDDDSSDLTEYTKKISDILESSKVCILETTYQTVSVRPSHVSAILVENVEDTKTEKKESTDIIKD